MGIFPSLLLAAGVVILASVDAAEAEGTLGGAPRGVRDDVLYPSIAILEAQEELHLGRAEGGQELEVALAVVGDVVEAVAQHHADDVLAPREQLGDVETHVERLAAVERPSGVEQVVAHLLSVQEEVEVPQSAHEGRGPLQFLAHQDALAELRLAIAPHHLVAQLAYGGL